VSQRSNLSTTSSGDVVGYSETNIRNQNILQDGNIRKAGQRRIQWYFHAFRTGNNNPIESLTSYCLKMAEYHHRDDGGSKLL
jgi:hypothetical protein